MMFFLNIQSTLFQSQPETLINYLLFSIIIFSIIIFFINFSTDNTAIFNITTTIILLHAVNLYVMNHTNYKIIGFLPFKALFGPLFLFHINFFNQKKNTLKIISWNFLTPMILFLCFLCLTTLTPIESSMLYYYLIILAEGLLMFVYGVYALLTRQHQHSAKLRDITSVCSIAFILDSLFTIMNSLTPIISNTYDVKNPSFVNTTFYLVSVSLGWTYYLSSIKMMLSPDIMHPSELPEKASKHNFLNPDIDQNTSEGNDSYKKGRLTELKLDEYEALLNDVMNSESLYLQNELTLTLLARKLKITNHHLTQVLNIRVGLNFYQYINKLRILHAKKIIDLGLKDSSIETLAISSGFNNRASFNRYFKENTGTSPSSYIKDLNSTENL